MKDKKKTIIMSALLLAIVLLGVGTIAYFRRTVNGNITGQSGNLVLVVNEVDSVSSQTFTVSLNRSEEEPFVMPGDKGSFDINVDSTGSSTDVAVTINIVRASLPDNLKFYLDENYTKELTSKTYMIVKSDEMIKDVKVYWYWDGSKDDVNDSLFINSSLSATVQVSASIAKTLRETLLAQNITVDTNVDFHAAASSTNGEGLMMVSGTENDTYPILYYRGDVSNNNVVFADYCWLIVRTTETGGTKLIYNGEVNEDGTCTDYTKISLEYKNLYINKTTSAFNTKKDSPVYVGYMYNDDNKYFSSSTLDVSGYKAHLLDESKLDNGTGRHVQNKYDSTIKGVIDEWYRNNLLNTEEEKLLEDTVWCNDRSIASTEYPLEDYDVNLRFRFSGTARFRETSLGGLSLTCSRDVDKFTVSSSNGNGDLDHAIGMLTYDEVMMSGIRDGGGYYEPSYLIINNPNFYYYIMTPHQFREGAARAIDIGTNGIYTGEVSTAQGVRAALSLKADAHIIIGNGTFENPYKIG